MGSLKMSMGVVIGAATGVIVMALVVAGYLVDTYSNASLVVAALATLIVAVTIAIPYWAAQRMCARKAHRLAAQQD
jgi:protein-S-isoprenylcysteine O-methyltransferase Ste14